MHVHFCLHSCGTVGGWGRRCGAPPCLAEGQAAPSPAWADGAALTVEVSRSGAGGDGRVEGEEETGKTNEGVGYLEEKGKSHCVRMCKVHGELI